MTPVEKLKADYAHLLGRTWDLFVFGRKREMLLEEAVANAWKQFERIREITSDQKISAMCAEAESFLLDRLRAKTPELEAGNGLEGGE